MPEPNEREGEGGPLGPRHGHDPPAGGEGDRSAAMPAAPGVARRLLTWRVPLWAALAAVLGVVVVSIVLLVSRPRVDLGPAVDGAVNASVELTICNETVDRRGLNPRTAELEFQSGLEDLGVQEATVVVNRINCGPDAP